MRSGDESNQARWRIRASQVGGRGGFESEEVGKEGLSPRSGRRTSCVREGERGGGEYAEVARVPAVLVASSTKA